MNSYSLQSTRLGFSGLQGVKNRVNTVKHVFNGHSKIDKTKILKTNGSLLKVDRIAECSLGALIYYNIDLYL